MQPKTLVDIIVLDLAFEALAVRSALELWNVQVTMHPVGEAKDLVSMLRGKGMRSTIIFLIGHGDDGFVLPELNPDLEKDQPYHQRLTPEDLKEFLHLPGCTVISCCCSTGGTVYADSFLSGGCKAYIGPDGDPDGDAALFYSLHLAYEWICKGTDLKTAHQRAASHDSQTAMFKLY
jgi:hypothetical protein